MTSYHDLKSFVEELDCEYGRWYAKSVRRCFVLWGSLQLLAILSGFLTAILAAFAAFSSDQKFPLLGRIVLVVLPLLGSLAATILLQFRVYDLWRLREQGRLAFQRLAAEGRRRLASASGEEACGQIYEDLQHRAMEVEEAQAGRFFGLWKGDFVGEYAPGREHD